MQIRQATEADLDWLVHLGRRAHLESPRYQHVRFDAERTREFARMVLTNEWTLSLVAEVDGAIVGSLMGLVAPHIFSDQLYASDIFFYVVPEHRGSSAGPRLLKEWERVMREDGRVVETVLGISSEINAPRTRQLYERLGYRAAGYMMVKHYE